MHDRAGSTSPAAIDPSATSAAQFCCDAQRCSLLGFACDGAIFFGLSVRDGMMPRGFGGRSVSSSHAPRHVRHPCVYVTGATGRRNKTLVRAVLLYRFDDPEARAMHDVDFDLSDSARALIRNGINIDDRTAVESAPSDSAGYTHDPAVFARYVDEVIKTARRYVATGQTD